jgi:hypothetical protein
MSPELHSEIEQLRERVTRLERASSKRGRTNLIGAARYLNISDETLRQRHARGEGPHRTKNGGSIRTPTTTSTPTPNVSAPPENKSRPIVGRLSRIHGAARSQGSVQKTNGPSEFERSRTPSEQRTP